MTFLTPLLAGIAAAIAVPTLVILYFLKLRRRDVEISTTLLWKKAIEDLQANAPFQRLRRNILLILQLLVLAAALFALAQPQMKAMSLAGNKYVILVDRSASMSSNDEYDRNEKTDAPRISRLDAAKKQASVLIDSLAEASVFGTTFGNATSDEAMLIAFDSTAEVRQTFTTDKRALKAAIEAITPGQGATRIEEAMRLARAHAPKKILEDVRTDDAGNVIKTQHELEGITAGAPLSIHLWSDGRIPDADRARPNVDDGFTFHPVGSPTGHNVGITSLRAERDFEDVAKLSVFVTLEHNSPTPRTLDVELLVEGQSRIKSLTLPPATGFLPGNAVPRPEPADSDKSADRPAQSITSGVGGVVFTIDRQGGAIVEVNLRKPGSADAPDDDVLAVDNRAWVVAPPAKRLAVLVVGNSPDVYVDTVLASLNLSRLTNATPAELESLLKEGKTGEFDLIVLNRYVPTTGRNATGLPPGRYLALGAIPTNSDLSDLGPAPGATIIDWSRSHPALRDVVLDGIVASDARKLQLTERSQAIQLATADTGVAIAEISSVETRAIITAFHPADSTWIFRDSFVIFTVGALKYLGQDIALGGTPRTVQPGGTLSDRLPGGAAKVEIETPEGVKRDLTLSPDGRFAFAPVTRSGIYKVSWEGPAGPSDDARKGGASRYFAANLLDPEESETLAAPSLALADRIVAAQAKAPSQSTTRLWPYLLLGALAVMMLEWFVFNRKVHV